jgi:hypothetical protein
MTRRRHEVRKEDILKIWKLRAQVLRSWGHLQKWVKKTEQSEQNGSLKEISSLTSS